MILLYSGQSDMDMCYVSKMFLQSMKFPYWYLYMYSLNDLCASLFLLIFIL